MNRVDFHLVNKMPIENYVCKLAEKAFKKNVKTIILTGSKKLSEKMDGLLWSFNASSYLPHCHLDKINQYSATILAENTIPTDLSNQSVVINMANSIPENKQQLRLIDVFSGNNEEKTTARNRFRHYTNLGYQPQFVKI